MEEKKEQAKEIKTDDATRAGKTERVKEVEEIEKLTFSKLQPYQKNRYLWTFCIILLIGVSFLTYTCASLYKDKTNEDKYWDSYLTVDSGLHDRIDDFSTDATKVSVGTYVENLKEINLKNNSFSLDMLVWFNWDGDENLDMTKSFRIYKGNITKQETVENYTEGNHHYQLVRLSATISKAYWTPRFPLESHQLRVYIEATHPVDNILFVKDGGESVNPNMSLSGYDLARTDSAVVAAEYVNGNGDPRFDGQVIRSEFVTQLEIERTDFGLYLKCFIALFGTTVWMFFVLFINTKHRIDPLSMIPAALFGTVSNIMVGANLLPDALSIGLLEYVNFWGIFTILAVSVIVINVNRVRAKYGERVFAHYYGSHMFKLMIILVLAGHILLPLCAYRF